MASVTNLKTIVNNTNTGVTFINGENASQIFTIAGNSSWNGDLWVPWIGNQGEAGKAIRILSGRNSEDVVFLFQDYWHPAHADAVKYVRDNFDYESAKEVEGENRGGGNKALIINPFERTIDLIMY